MPSQARVTLADFPHLGLSLTWPEAVVIVVEVAERVKRTAGTLVTPDPDHIIVGPNSELTIIPGSPIPAHPVRQAARLLSDLLQDTPAPAELRELVEQNLQDPPACAWIEEFTNALRYFESPRPEQIVEALAARAIAAQEIVMATNSEADRLHIAGSRRRLSEVIARLREHLRGHLPR